MDILGIGTPEFIFILIIALLLFGPRRLVEIATGAGKIIRTLRYTSRDLMTAWQQEVKLVPHLEELQEARQELEKMGQELRQARMAVNTDLSEMRTDLSTSSSSIRSSRSKDLSSATAVSETTSPHVIQKEGVDEEQLPQPDQR